MCGPEQHSPCSCCVGDDGRGCLLRRLRHKSTSNSAHVSHWLLRRPWSQVEGSPERLHLLLLQPLSQKEPPQHVHVQLRFRRPCSRMEEQPQLLHWFLTRLCSQFQIRSRTFQPGGSLHRFPLITPPFALPLHPSHPFRRGGTGRVSVGRRVYPGLWLAGMARIRGMNRDMGGYQEFERACSP